MQVLPLKTALLEIAREHEETAQHLERRAELPPFWPLAKKAEAERRLAEEARTFAEGLRF